jgi:hypothetical protein
MEILSPSLYGVINLLALGSRKLWSGNFSISDRTSATRSLGEASVELHGLKIAV